MFIHVTELCDIFQLIHLTFVVKFYSVISQELPVQFSSKLNQKIRLILETDTGYMILIKTFFGTSKNIKQKNIRV